MANIYKFDNLIESFTRIQHCEEDREEHAKSCQLLRICLEDHRQEKIFVRKITGERTSFIQKQSNQFCNFFIHVIISTFCNKIIMVQLFNE